jgi:hypothetical protein
MKVDLPDPGAPPVNIAMGSVLWIQTAFPVISLMIF